MYWIISPRRCRRLALPMAALVLLSVLRWVSPAVPTAAAPQEGVAVPIIMYHSILPRGQSPYIVTPALLEQDLQYLQRQGRTAVTVADLIAYVDEGIPLPDKPVMLTFDDGYYNNYLYAHPLLKQYGMRGVISPIAAVSEQYSDHPDQQDHPRYSHVTWEQLTEMTASGVWEIGHHSYNLHVSDGGRKGVVQTKGESAEAYRAALTADLTRATKLLQGKVGVTPTVFVYPFGAYTKATDPILRELGFRATLTCEERVSRVTRDPDSLWRLGRYLRPPDVSSEAYFEPIFRKAEE